MTDCKKCAKVRKLAEECNNAQTDEPLANQICRAFARRLFAILDEQDPIEQAAEKVIRTGNHKNLQEYLKARRERSYK